MVWVNSRMAARHPGGSGGDQGYPGGYGGRGGHGAHGGGRSGGEGGHQGSQHDSTRDLVDTPREMTITETASEIALAEKDGRLRLLHPGAETFPDADGAQVRTHWENGHLVVDTQREQGPRVTETYTLSPEPRQFVIDVLVESRFLGVVTIKRVYDPAVTD